MANNDPLSGLGQGMGELFGGLLGGMTQGLGNAVAQNPDVAKLFGGGDGDNPWAAMAAAGQDQGGLNKVFADALAGGVKKSEYESRDPFTRVTRERKKKTDFTQQETLSPACFNREMVDLHGCYSPDSLDYDKLPVVIEKIDFHGDGYFNDYFVHLLSNNTRLSLSSVQCVDVRGCANLTDIGVIWLSSLLRASSNLHTILLGGCPRVTEQGVASFQQLPSDLTLSLVGTGVTTLPTRLLNKDTQLNGCPLINGQNIDLKPVPMQKLVVHLDQGATSSFAALMATKQKEAPLPLKYLPSWTCGESDFSITETLPDQMGSEILSPMDGQQIIIPVNVDTSPESAVKHVINTVQYHVDHSDRIMQYRHSFGQSMRPLNLLNTVWDAARGRIMFKGANVDPEDSDDEEGGSFAILAITLTKTRPYIKLQVECSPDTPFSASLGLVSKDKGELLAEDLKFKNGDVLKFGIKDPENMEYETILDGKEHTMYYCKNEQLRAGAETVYLTYHPEYEQGQQMADDFDDSFSTKCYVDKAVPSLNSPDEVEAGMKALRDCNTVLVLISKQFCESEEHMEKIRAAMKLQKKVVYIDLVSLNGVQWDRFPYKKEDIQIIELSEDDDEENGAMEILNVVMLSSMLKTENGIYFTHHHEHEAGAELCHNILEEAKEGTFYHDKSNPSDQKQFAVEDGLSALRHSNLVIIILSQKFSDSEECMKKMRLAMELKKPIVYINTEDDPVQWEDFEFPKEDLKLLDFEEEEDDDVLNEQLNKIIATSKTSYHMEDIGSWSSGSFQFGVVAKTAGAVQFLNYMPVTVSATDGKQDPVELIMAENKADPSEAIIFDNPSGTCRTQSLTALVRPIQHISSTSNKLSLRATWQTDSVVDSDSGTVTEAGVKRIVLGIGTDMDADSHPSLDDVSEQEYTHSFLLEKSGQDVIHIEVDIADSYMVPYKKYPVKFYKNNELIIQMQYTQTVTQVVPFFIVAIDEQMEVHIQDYTPPQWFTAMMQVEAQLPPDFFIFPHCVGDSTAVTNTTVTFEEAPLWTVSKDNSFTALTSLTQHNPGFKVVLKTDAEKEFYIGAPTVTLDTELWHDKEGLRLENSKEGDTIVCMLKTEGCKFDRFGIPISNQDITLTYTVNGKEVKVVEKKYLGGGLFPSLAGNAVTFHLTQMDLAKHTQFTNKAKYPQKNFVVVANTKETNLTEAKENIVSKLQSRVIGQLTSNQDEVKVIRDATRDKIPTSFCGDLVKTRMEVQNMNRELLTSHLHSLITFTAINTNTMEGHGELCRILSENHNRFMFEEAHIYSHSDIVRNAIDKILKAASSHKMMSRDECRGRWGLSETQLVGVFRLLHSWGKVVFLPDLTPCWVVILDVEWYVGVVRQLHQVPQDQANGRVRSLHPSTPVFDEQQLAKDQPLEKRKVLLDVIEKAHHIVRLTGFRTKPEDAQSYLVNPRHVKDTSVPLSNFYDPDDPNTDMLTVTLSFSLGAGVDLGVCQAVLCELSKVSPPVVMAPTFMVQQIGASQVVFTWTSPKSDKDEVELKLVVSTFLPLEEIASKGIVTEYSLTIMHCFQDIISHLLLSAKTPFVTSCDPQINSGNMSICSSHRWDTRSVDDLGVSVCSLCTSCSEYGVQCKYNHIRGPYDMLHCQCGTQVVCCQDCGICQTCCQQLWSIRSLLHPCKTSVDQLVSRSVFGGKMVYTNTLMTPAIFDEATLIKTRESDATKDVNFGLLSEDGEKYIQLFPGKALVGLQEHCYHRQTRQALTFTHVKDNVDLNFDLGDRITIQMSEPHGQSLDAPQHAAPDAGTSDEFRVSTLHKANCSLSRASNTVRGTSDKELGLLMSQRPLSTGSLYFDVEIVSLSSGGRLAGVGMAPNIEIGECIGHGTGHSLTEGCKAWINEWWHVGDIIGCGSWRTGDHQEVVFTHNDQVVCRHVLTENCTLHPAVLVRAGEAVTILHNDTWKNPTDIQNKTESMFPTDQEFYESDTGEFRISPKSTLLFEQGVDDSKRPTSNIYLENKSNRYVLWKVRTNVPETYICNPNRGVIRPGEMTEIINECKSADRSMEDDKFQIMYTGLRNDELNTTTSVDVEKVTELWNNKTERKEFTHVVRCQWKTDRDQAQLQETTFAVELDDTNFTMVEPSYQVTVLKNGSPVSSYWLPKGNYRFAMDNMQNEAETVLNQDIILHAPKLPVQDRQDGFRVGMTINVEVDKSIISQSFEEAITSVCARPSSIFAVCQIDMVEQGSPDMLHLSFHGSPGNDQSSKSFSLKVPADSPTLHPVKATLSTSEEVSVFLEEGNVVQLIGYIPDTCRTAPKHLFEQSQGKLEPYSGRPCENLLFGAHRIHLARDQLVPKADTPRLGPSYMFLPAKLSPDTLRHPSLQQLHNFSKMKIYPVCQVNDQGYSQDWHLMDTEGYVPDGYIPYSLIYRNLPIMNNYIDLASKMVRLPSHAKFAKDSETMPRNQVEALLLTMLQTYALTAQLLSIPRYMKASLVDTETGRTWEPSSFLPLDCTDDVICSTHKECTKQVTGSYTELARHCCIHYGDDVTDQDSNNDTPDSFTVTTKDAASVLAKMPWLQTLVIKGTGSSPAIHLSLPELTSVINTSPCNVFIDDCPKLITWEGPMTTDVEAQLELLTRCTKLERLVINENSIQKLPAGIGKLQQLKSLVLPRSHLTELPHSFTALKNLTELRITGPVAHWSKNVELTIHKDEIWRQFPFVSEQDLDAALKTHSWDGDTLRVRTSDQHGKLVSTFYVLSAKFGKKEADAIYGGFPREILQLTGLRHLHLSYQGIRSVPPQISRLVNLHTLELDGCLDLESLPSTLGFLNLKRLSLQGCLSLRTPSREIVERGTEAVSAYLKQMARGKSKNWRTKLMLVGIGGAGKTTLLRALKNSSHKAKGTSEEEITHGIDIDTWTASDERTGKKVTFNAWDFAGQTVFYNTHQFFMSDRAVYLLVWSCRQGFDNSGLEFWLSSIQCHSPNTPVFVVATHADRLTTDLPKGQLQETYPQIAGFFYVGSTTGKGIPELKGAILSAALDLDYMGEDVPTVYLDLEQKLLSLRDEDNPYIEWSVVRQYAMEAGIFDDKDVARAVQFLQHIGSVQYFDYALLRDYVVINPQWIVGAMASVVTFKDSVIKNGRLYHKHVGQLWKQYPAKLHEWLLRLTEMFDLTFQINKDLSLVPCLLSNEQPEQAKWPPRDELKDSSMMLIVYTFRYLPTGLFNRLQARLFEFSNGKTVWKKGSILEKKGHYAYIKHERDQRLSVQVMGRHPENILFLIHETLEDLINLSYRGIQFEYLIPCPDCVKELGMDNPAMFRASLVREAAKCSAPYLQCRRLFHTVPMAMAKALMPPNDNQELDLQLQRSIQSLGEMRGSLQTDVFMLFSASDILTEELGRKLVDPRRVYADLKDKFSCFFDENMNNANMQSLMVSMQEAKTLLVFISNNFVKDARCSQLLQYAHSAFQDRLCLVNLSADYGWKKDTAGFILSQMVFVNMKMYDAENYKKQIQQLEEMLQEKLGIAKNKTSERPQDPVCFVSYAWTNSKIANASRKLVKKEATALDPRTFKERIEKEIKIPCWLDVEQTGKRGLFEDITEGLRAADLMVAFVSNEYLNSANCMMELRFAVSTLKIPVIFVAVGIGMDWQFEEVGTLMRNAKAPLVDMRNEVTDTNARIVMDFVQKHVLSPEQREAKMNKMKSVINKMSIVELANISYHEEFELAQRKLMRRLTYVASHQSVIPYPRIFILDFVDTDKTNTDKKSTTNTSNTPKRPESAVKTLARRRSTLQRKDSVLFMTDTPKEENKLSLDDPLCVRYLCEHAEGWHATSAPLELRGLTVRQKEALLEQMAPYLARTLTILKHSSIPLNCMKGDEGKAFKEFLVKLALEAHEMKTKDAFEKAYIALLQYVIEQDKEMTKGNLKLCVLSGGRVRWLCPEHQKGYRVTVLNTDVSQRVSSQKEDTDFTKGIMDGLKELWEKFSPHQTAAAAQAAHTVAQTNIAEVLHNAFLDFSPKMGSLKKMGGKIFKQFKQYYEEQEQQEKEQQERTTKPVPKPRSRSAKAPVAAKPGPSTAPNKPVKKKGKKATPANAQKQAAAQQLMMQQQMQQQLEQQQMMGHQAQQPMNMDNMTVEMQQQLQQQMQEGLMQGLMGGMGGGDGENNTSQACVIL